MTALRPARVCLLAAQDRSRSPRDQPPPVDGAAARNSYLTWGDFGRQMAALDSTGGALAGCSKARRSCAGVVAARSTAADAWPAHHRREHQARDAPRLGLAR